jgi:hypothetical protein
MWLIFLERIINGITVDEETVYIQAKTFEGASLKAMEYFIEDGWEVIGAQEQVA